MLEKGKISNSQFTNLSIMFLIGTSALIAPTIIAEHAGRDAWLSIVFGASLGVMFSIVHAKLADRYPTLTLVEYSEKILGKWLGKMVSMLFFLYFLLLTSGLLRITVDLILTHILPETPIQAIEVLFMIIVIYGVRLGLEPFARTTEMLIPYVLSFILILTILLLDEIKLDNILPILEDGIKPVLSGTYRTFGIPFLDLVVLLMIAPFVTSPEKVKKNLITATLLSGTIITLVTGLSISILGTELTVRLHYPTYVLAQKVEVGDFLERIEVLSGGLIFIALFIKVSICFYSMVLSMAQILQLNNYRTVTYPLGLLVMFLSILLFPNIIFFRTFLSNAWTPMVIFFGLVLPLLLFLVDMIRNGVRKKKGNESKQS
jgi:spore germination protein KB